MCRRRFVSPRYPNHLKELVLSGVSQLQVIIYSVHDEEVDAVLAAFHGARVASDYGLGPVPRQLELGFVYGTGEVAAGSARTLADTLMSNAPSAAFVVWQDPSYPANGAYIARVPDVGNLETECDVHGTPVISLRKVIPFFTTSRRVGWTRTEDNAAGQIRDAAEVLDALAVLAERLPGAARAE
ncbi:hypothetical protein [Streptomyces sp. WM6378]|uniref:hypothetical protein n=1 Tax=Streptomyces sp. WM6378 TaxID=1415557 RepID=UPI0006B00CAA|nr:hypothetical protein [Streptomyces sp. WM6378]KOU43226.1 hypothetical protein ADK54_18115 [Streptomyces sp. WM6378]